MRAPMDTLRDLILTPEDVQDLKDVQPFVLTTDEHPQVLIRYLGKETLDEIPCYVFAVKPKKMEQGGATSRARSGWTTATCRS